MLKQSLNQKLLQKLSPQQIQFIKLLQLNTLNFEQRVEEELLENPALEEGKEDEDVQSDEIEREEDEFDDYDDHDYEEQSVSADDDFDLSDYLNEEQGGISMSSDYSPDDEKEGAPIVYHENFRERLLDQMAASLGTEKDHILADQLIGTLDDDGYLRRPLKSIVNDLLFSANIRSTEEELESVLREIQQCEPVGVGARDLRECLLLQIKRKEKKGNSPIIRLARLIVEEHMDDFSKKHYSKLLKKLDVSDEYLREAIEFITKLNPKPAQSSSEGTSSSNYIIPDFIVKEEYGELEVTLNSRNAPDLKVSRSYLETLKAYEAAKKKEKSQKEAVQFIKQKLDGAKWFIDSIKQRQATLLLTMNKIVELQREFFLSGEETDLRPMILKDIADPIGLDISTISRVANSKYVETDHGIYHLKDFFSEGIVTESGEEVSNREVKKILKDAIDAEDKSKPLTDQKLKDLLEKKGYKIARRTVAKYREQMNLPVARLRKQL
jgi:RNA polymerase sigma-54 factor